MIFFPLRKKSPLYEFIFDIIKMTLFEIKIETFPPLVKNARFLERGSINVS